MSTDDSHSCQIFLESEDGSSATKVLPASMISINVIPVPILTDINIFSAYLLSGPCGDMLNVRLTDRAAYELYQMLPESIGRRLILEYDGNVLGFSKILEKSSVELVFIPEVSDDACQAFCRFISSRK